MKAAVRRADRRLFDRRRRALVAPVVLVALVVLLVLVVVVMAGYFAFAMSVSICWSALARPAGMSATSPFSTPYAKSSKVSW